MMVNGMSTVALVLCVVGLTMFLGTLTGVVLCVAGLALASAALLIQRSRNRRLYRH